MLTNVHFPLLPLELVAVHLETDTFRLKDVEGFQVVPKFEILIVLGDEVREEVKPLGGRWDALSTRVIQCRDIQRVRSCCGRGKFMFFFLFINVGIVRGEVNVYDFSRRNIDDGDKVLYKNQGHATGDRGREMKYQGMSIKIFVFGISSEDYPLLDSRGKREPIVIADCPAVSGDLVGLDAYETFNSKKRFSTEGEFVPYQLPLPAFEPRGLLSRSSHIPQALLGKFEAASQREACHKILRSIHSLPGQGLGCRCS